MSQYYLDSVESGVYVACRGITDTWDLHFQADSYPLYDRLIEAMTVLYHADPDRVYLLGFSAGGDGVYQAAPRLAGEIRLRLCRPGQRPGAQSGCGMPRWSRRLRNLGLAAA